MCVIDFIMFEMEVLVCSHQTDFQTDLILTRPLQSPTFLSLPLLFLSFSSLTKVVFPNLLLPASCLIFTLSTLFFWIFFLSFYLNYLFDLTCIYFSVPSLRTDILWQTEVLWRLMIRSAHSCLLDLLVSFLYQCDFFFFSWVWSGSSCWPGNSRCFLLTEK